MELYVDMYEMPMLDDPCNCKPTNLKCYPFKT